MSESFEGYKKQLCEMAKDTDFSKEDSMVSVFIKNILGALGKDPGRLINDEKERPFNEIIKDTIKKKNNIKSKE